MTIRESIDERDDRLRQGAREQELRRALAFLVESFPQEGQFRALAMLVVDALLDGDEHALDAAFVGLQNSYGASGAAWSDVEAAEAAEARGRILGLIDVAHWAIERSISLSLLVEFERDSHAHKFLHAISEGSGLANRDLVTELETSETEVSRVGRRLIEAGAATKRRVGRRNFWEITPRGLQMLQVLDRGGIGRFLRPHYQRA